MEKLKTTSIDCSTSPFPDLCNFWANNELPGSTPVPSGYNPVNQFYALYQMSHSATNSPTYIPDSESCALNAQICSIFTNPNNVIPIAVNEKNTTPGIIAAKLQALVAIQWMAKNSNSLGIYTQPFFSSLLTSTDVNATAFIQNIVSIGSGNNFYNGMSPEAVDMLWSTYVEPFYTYLTGGSAPKLPSYSVTFTNNTGANIQMITQDPDSTNTIAPGAPVTLNPTKATFNLTDNVNYNFTVYLSSNSYQIAGTYPNQSYYTLSMKGNFSDPTAFTYTIEIDLPKVTINNKTAETLTISSSDIGISSVTGGGSATGTLTTLSVPQFQLTSSNFVFDVNLSERTYGYHEALNPPTQPNYGIDFLFQANVYTIDIYPAKVTFQNNTPNQMTFAFSDANAFIPSTTCPSGVCTLQGNTTLTATVNDFISAVTSVTVNGTDRAGDSITPTITITPYQPPVFSQPNGVANQYTINAAYDPASSTYTMGITDASKPAPPPTGTSYTIRFINETGNPVTLQSTLISFTKDVLVPVTGKIDFVSPGSYTIDSSCTAPSGCTTTTSTTFDDFITPKLYGETGNGTPGYSNILGFTDVNGNWIYIDLNQMNTYPIAGLSCGGWATQPALTNFSYVPGTKTYSITIPESQTKPPVILTIHNNTPYALNTGIQQGISSCVVGANKDDQYGPGVINGHVNGSGGFFILSPSTVNVNVVLDPTQVGSGVTNIFPVDTAGNYITVNEAGQIVSGKDAMFTANFSLACADFPASCTGNNGESVFQIVCSCDSATNNLIMSVGYKTSGQTAIFLDNNITSYNTTLSFSVNENSDLSAYSNLTPNNLNFTLPESSASNPTSVLTLPSTTSETSLVLTGNTSATLRGDTKITWGSDLIAPTSNTISSHVLGGINGQTPYTLVTTDLTTLQAIPSPTLVFVNNTGEPVLASLKSQNDITPTDVTKLVWGSGGYTIEPSCSGTGCSATFNPTTFAANDPSFTLTGTGFSFAATFAANTKPGLPASPDNEYLAQGDFDGLSKYTITVTKIPSIEFYNTTDYPIDIVGATSLGDFTFSDTSCLTPPVGTVPYQIPPNMTGSCQAFIGTLDITKAIQFNGMNTNTPAETIFTFPIIFGTTTTVPLQNAVVSLSGSVPNYSLSVSPAKIEFSSGASQTLYMATGDPTAFSAYTGGSYTSSGYPITGTNYVGTIGSLLNETSAINFNTSDGKTQFTVDFRTTPVTVANQPGAMILVSQPPLVTNGAIPISFDQLETISYTNTTGYDIQVSGAADNLFNSSTCWKQGGPYVITGDCEVTLASGVTASQLNTYTGVIGSTALFKVVANFGTSTSVVTPALAVAKPTSKTTTDFALNFSPATILFSNQTTEKIDIATTAANDFIAPNTCVSDGGTGYYIPESNSCSATIGTLLNNGSAVHFNIGSATQFIVDFANPLVVSPQSGAIVKATPGSGTNGELVFNITFATVLDTITFTNTTGYNVQVSGAADNLFNSSTCWNPGGPYVITHDCEVTLAPNVMPSQLNTYIGVNGKGNKIFKAVVDFASGSVSTPPQNAVVTPGSKSLTDYTLSFTPAKIAFSNTIAAVNMVTGDENALSGYPAGSGGTYPIGTNCNETNCVGIIQNLLNDPAIPFNIGTATQFTIDFTQDPAAITNNPGMQLQAAIGTPTQGEQLLIAITKAPVLDTITFTNTTGYDVQVSGASDSLINSSTCWKVGGPYVISKTLVDACHVRLALGVTPSQLNTYIGVNVKGDQIFEVVVDFDSGTLQTIPQNAVVTPGATSPTDFTLAFTPAKIAFSNTIAAVNMVTGDGNALSGYPAGSGGTYLIGTNCNETNCEGSIQNLLNDAAIPFNIGTETQFTIDFTKEPALIKNVGTQLQAAIGTPTEGEQLLIAITSVVAPTNDVAFKLTGSLTELFLDSSVTPANALGTSNMIYLRGPSIGDGETGLYMNLSYILSNTSLNPNNVVPEQVKSSIKSDQELYNVLSHCLDTVTIDAGSVTTLVAESPQPNQPYIGSSVPSIINLVPSSSNFVQVAYNPQGEITFSPMTNLEPETFTLTSQSLLPLEPFVPATLTSFPSSQAITMGTSVSVNATLAGAFKKILKLSLALQEISMTSYAFYKFNTTPSIGSALKNPISNSGILTSTNQFLFTFTFPGTPAQDVTSIVSGGLITIGSNTSINISGSLSSLSVSGTVQGVAIASGSTATVWIPSQHGQTGNALIVISGTLTQSVGSLTYSDGISGQVLLTFE